MALGYLDVDGFKEVNDRLGHDAGDQVLKAVATALAGRLRASDLAARMGGDEFVVLLPETDLAGARHFFSEMREILLGMAASRNWPIGFSIGVVVFHTVLPDAEEAIRRADQLMYKVKNAGKNDVAFAQFEDAPGAGQVLE